jgi:hypothetical protein
VPQQEHSTTLHDFQIILGPSNHFSQHSQHFKVLEKPHKAATWSWTSFDRVGDMTHAAALCFHTIQDEHLADCSLGLCFTGMN